LHHAEKMIKGAFIELYKGLGYLKTYRYLIWRITFFWRKRKKIAAALLIFNLEMEKLTGLVCN
jgi:hypothetical protein